LVENQNLVGLHRIAIAVYEPKSDELLTYSYAGDTPSPLTQYSAQLSDSDSLLSLSRHGGARIIHDLKELPKYRRHSVVVLDSGFRSSLTIPITYQSKLYGFVFFNSREPGFFQGYTLELLLPYARLVGILGANSIREARLIKGTVGSTIALSKARDIETSEHMERIASLSSAMAKRLAVQFNFSDEYITMLEQFAPLHDLGKLSIPDNILLKPGPLYEDEFAHMKTHVRNGLELLDSMISQLDLGDNNHMEILREIIAYHHERLDGSGYPYGLKDEDIPWAGRIVGVADVYDALTSKRPYKPAWSREEACALLRREAGTKLCPHCVTALFQELEDRPDHGPADDFY
jgi:HD-GYP domain-containing protein (c-di-GMP phosphodiesterase class II)